MATRSLELCNWQFRQAETNESWRDSVPGACTQIHADLLHHQEIPDPFLDMNEKKVQWVGEAVWEYKNTFEVEKSLQKLAHSMLVFEGLDTFATVFLNGTKILEADNMFCQDKVDVGGLLNFGAANVLEITFDSALLVARELEKENGKFICWNGESCRLHIRKAQYHFGWDWGPVLMTCGPYRPVRLVSYNSTVEDVNVKVEVDEHLDAEVEVVFEVAGTALVSVTIVSPDGTTNLSATNLSTTNLSCKFSLKKPQLWYPWSIGTPALHTVNVEVVESGVVVESFSKKVGLRNVELVQEPLEGQDGTSFYFRINGIPVYCAGSNWIPAHSFLTMLTDNDYTEWLELAVSGNQNMIRVWGGGFYEHDIFYSECDRLGLLVWQDFMFACGQYPGDKKFVSGVTKEVEHQLKRLRNHACLALFAGNNEDYQIAEVNHLTWEPNDTSGDYSHTDFPARTIYENTLPTLMEKHLPQVPYHPGSPWGGGKPTTDPTVGDLHQWNVWHGTQEKYQNWHKLGGRFVSEFGMEALPSIKTYRDCITDPGQLYPQSECIDHHNKADGFERRLALYVIENIRVTSLDLEPWIYATQLMQAECLAYAYRSWRRDWKCDKKRYAGGALVWQINDCWPVASWAIVDFFRRPKLAFYAVRRESQVLGLGMHRHEKGAAELDRDNAQPGKPHDYSQVKYLLDFWGVNSSMELRVGTLVVDIYDVRSGEKVHNFSEKVSLAANGSSEFASGFEISPKLVAYARLVDESGSLLASAADWPQPLKYLLFPGRNVTAEVKDGKVVLNTNRPVKGVEIVLELDIFLEDNGFDLFPGDPKIVNAKGSKATDTVNLRYYGSG